MQTSESTAAPGKTALLLIDVINDLDFEGGEDLVSNATPCIQPINSLAARARLAGVPVIYANDNFGDWNADFGDIVARCTKKDVPGHNISTALAPQEGDLFILKPKHSAFHLTSLDALLRQRGVERLILCGFAGDICVLYTAHDAHMREFEVVVPRDCIASESEESNQHIINLLERTMGADTRPSAAIRMGSVVPQA